MKKRLLCGREFTKDELWDVKETVEMFPGLSRTEIAKTICENLNWVTPRGTYKVSSASQLLEKMENKGYFKLPEKKLVTSTRKLKPVMITSRTDPEEEITGSISDLWPIRVEMAIKKDEKDLWNEYVERYHTLGFKRTFGARQRYFIVSRAGDKKKYLGCLNFSSAAWSLAPREEYIGWSDDDKVQRLNGIINNSRFLVFPWVKVRNLGSKSLSIIARQIRDDWQKRFHYKPVLMETFVDEHDHQGTSYRAANWKMLGITKGRGRMSKRTDHLMSTPKYIFVYPLIEDFRDYLLGKHPEWEVGNYSRRNGDELPEW